MKKSEDEPKKGAPAYMNTYGDMMTLLLTFFVLLFSMSSIDVAKFRAVIASFDGSIGVLSGVQAIEENMSMLGNGIRQFPEKKVEAIKEQGKNQKAQETLNQMKQNLEQYVEEKNLQEKVTVSQNGDEIILRFDDVLLFDTGKADIKPGAIPVLDTLGTRLKDYLTQGYRMRLEGHTDNVPIKTSQFPSNWELSAARAIAVAKFFTDEMSFEVSKISTEGFRDNVPIGDNNTPEGRAMNRRVEIKISQDNRS